MDLTQIIAVIFGVATVAAAIIAALITASAQIRSAQIQKPEKDKPSDVDNSGRWKNLRDPKTSSLEERVLAAHIEASMVIKPSSKLTIIDQKDLDAKQ